MSEQPEFPLSDPLFAELSEEDCLLMAKIKRAERLYPDLVKDVARQMLAEMATLKKITCDVIPFVTRCRLGIDIDNDILPWLTIEVCEQEAAIDDALSPRRSRVGKFSSFLKP
jgi:hypothetical protein